MTVAIHDLDVAQLQADRKNVVKFARDGATRRHKKLSTAAAEKPAELQQICLSLIKIAQQYVPSTAHAFSDFVEVVRCTKMLQKMGVAPAVLEKFKATIDSVGNELVLNSADYKDLRNKYVAGFATIADLTEKPAAGGSPEFQRGVREGYRRASDIAVMFLEDIENGAQNAKPAKNL